jgi:peptidyl-tRNA hydrolase, PTH1 family
MIIIGLGNPGAKYEKTRHNAGFWAIDSLAQKYGVSFQDKFEAQVAEIRSNEFGSKEKIFLLKPQTYMNESGRAVQKFLNFYKILAPEYPKQVIVVYDELDFYPGKVQMRLGGSSGGHNGINSITAHLGEPNWWRMRIGIGHPRDIKIGGIGEGKSTDFSSNQKQGSVSDWVLGVPGTEDRKLLEEAVQDAVQALEMSLKEGFRNAQDHLHRIINGKMKEGEKKV